MVSIDQLASLDVVRPIDVMGVLIASRLGACERGRTRREICGFFISKDLYSERSISRVATLITQLLRWPATHLYPKRPSGPDARTINPNM